MAITNKWIIFFLFTGTLTYCLSPGPENLLNNFNAWEIREQIIFFSGMLAVSFMVLAVLTSSRISWFNNRMGGLDKAYKIHKSAAIYCLVLSLLHCLMEKAPSWLISAGIIKHPGELGDDSEFTTLELFLWESGVTIAEYLIYGMFFLGFLALTHKIPYKYFRWSHKLFPMICILFMYHAATVQFKDRWLSTPGGYLLLLILAFGTVISFAALLQMIGFNKKYSSKISSIKRKNSVIEVTLNTEKDFNYHPGQYAFLRFTHENEPHPFTIASSGLEPNYHKFAIKQLGDFTRDLPHKLQISDDVIIEGPYGEFKFNDDRPRQVWLATGIGITPFLSRMAFLSKSKDHRQNILFIFCARGTLEDQYPDNLLDLCRDSGVHLKYVNTESEPEITVDKLSELTGCIENTSIWFCGAQGLLKVLQKYIKNKNIHSDNLHFDSFNMR